MTTVRVYAEVRLSRLTTFGVSIAVVVIFLFLSPEGRAHGEGAALFEGAEKVIMPFSDNPPGIDGQIQAGEYNAYGQWEQGGNEVFLAHNVSSIFVGIRQLGTGWVGIALSGNVNAGANVVMATVNHTAAQISDNFAANVTDEMVSEPDAALGGTVDILAFAATSSPASATYEFAIPLDSPDPHDQQVEPGTLYPFVVAFNETAQGLPAALAEGDVHLLQVYVARSQDDLAAIRDLLLANSSPVPALAAMAIFAFASGALILWCLAPKRAATR